MSQSFRTTPVFLAKRNRQGSHEHKVFQMNKCYEQPATDFKARNDSSDSGGGFNERYDSEDAKKWETRMYTLCKAFLALRDILSELECNKILMVFKECISVLDDFIKSFQTLENNRGWIQHVTQCRVAGIGFEEKTPECHSEIFCTLYSCNAANMLQEQILHCPGDIFIHHTEETNTFNHPLHAGIVRKACRAVEQLT